MCLQVCLDRSCVSCVCLRDWLKGRICIKRHRQFKDRLSKRLLGLWTCSLEILNLWQSIGKRTVESLWTCGEKRKKTKKKHRVYIYSHQFHFFWGSYIQNSSSSRGDSSTRRWRQPARWSARPLRDSWLISSWLDEPRGETEATGWLLRLEHMS